MKTVRRAVFLYPPSKKFYVLCQIYSHYFEYIWYNKFMEGKKYDTRFGGFPENFRENGVFAHNQVLVKIGDRVQALVDVEGGQIPKGAELEIEDIVIEPKAEARGFSKRIKFKGIEGDFNPKN